MPSSASNTQTFESALSDLEQLVETIEKGDVPLSKLVEKFEEGSKLLQYCQDKLGKAELKIEQLNQNQTESGLAPFENNPN